MALHVANIQAAASAASHAVFDTQQATNCCDNCRFHRPQVCLRLGGMQRLLWPPLAAGPPPGEVPLQPLLEVLRPDNLVGLFAAVLLEQRVLLRVSMLLHILLHTESATCCSRCKALLPC